jgi:hypothetical protein
MIHSSIIIVYTYIWYFDYYYTGHGVLISSVASLKIYSCYVNFKALSLFISFRNSLFLQSMNTEIFA